ncbi:hypothetical protein L0B53_13360 [Vibrio sp. SS-MA-C1-2]|uniref:hypothetical protein n=1 Tax=Vibrio sp. SS-MA-C1-2 TaxID=2908646 RepID=UPI001F37EF4F|nr:hypothetical protein [Vibrio sp. SS-MA-C1-2]UJF18008.1 hypothetical protein L0B53_13360 [Vibrio sp. SS-MA-C1-2]
MSEFLKLIKDPKLQGKQEADLRVVRDEGKNSFSIKIGNYKLDTKYGNNFDLVDPNTSDEEILAAAKASFPKNIENLIKRANAPRKKSKK